MTKFLYLIFLFFTLSVSAQIGTDNFSSKDDVLVVYKNASRDILIVKSAQNKLKIKSITIFNILGTQMAQFQPNASSIEIDMSRHRAGKYLLSYTLSDDTHKVKQIIKQ